MKKINDKLSIREFLSLTLWTIKKGFKISGHLYVFYIINESLQFLTPLASAFVTSQIISEAIIAVGRGTQVMSSRLLYYVIGFIALEGLQRLSGLGNTYFYSRNNYLVELKLGTEFLQKLASLDISYHEDPEIKTSIQKITESLEWRFMTQLGDIATLTGALLGFISGISIFLTLNPVIILIISLPIGIEYFLNVKFGRNIWSIWYTKGDEKKDSAHAKNGLSEKEVIQESKIYGFGNYLARKFETAHLNFIKSVKHEINQKFSWLGLNVIFSSAILGLVQLFLLSQLILLKISIQSYTFLWQCVSQINESFKMATRQISAMYENILYIRDYKDFMELKDVVVKPTNPIEIELKAPEIEFRNVSFKYPHSRNYVIKDLSFLIKSGEKVALVGENGAGKSTIIKLMARFYDVTSGEILVNGVNIKEIDIESYYKLWGVLFQHFARYWFTVRENIGIGNMEDMSNMKLIRQAGDKAGLEKVIKKLPHGYENMLNTDFKDGKDLSGGEWQKVGIARGMFANPKFIVLDEPTSALDALAEAKVFEEIEKLASDTTMLIVSHRFATVRNADKILVLENGQISEQGSHQQLMTHKNLYYNMFTTQAEGYK